MELGVMIRISVLQLPLVKKVFAQHPMLSNARRKIALSEFAIKSVVVFTNHNPPDHLVTTAIFALSKILVMLMDFVQENPSSALHQLRANLAQEPVSKDFVTIQLT